MGNDSLRVLGLLVPFLELNLFEILLGEHEEGRVASSGWPFIFAVPGKMTHLVASLTIDSAKSYVIQGAFLTQGKASSMPIVFSWGDNISPDGFLPSIMLLLVIIVAVAIVVMVILVVVVVKGKMVSEAKRSLDKSSEESEEVFPGEAGE
ncbi:hypothetical protein Tco_1224672 [Tanacetum coccineum]